MQPTIPTGVAVDFDVSPTPNTQAVPGGPQGGIGVVITVSGCNVRISNGGNTVTASSSGQTGDWENLLFLDGSVQTWRRKITGGGWFSVVCDDGASTGTVQIVPVEGN